MRKSILAIILATMAFAATASFTVTLQTATEREDNSPLGLSEIKGHNMYCGTVAGDMAGSYAFEKRFLGAALPSTEIIVDSIPTGTFYCHFTTMDIDERESVISPEYLTLVNAGKFRPKPPTVTAKTIRMVTTVTQ